MDSLNIGEGSIEINESGLFAENSKLLNELKSERSKSSMNKDFLKDLNSVKEQFVKKGYIDSEGNLNENQALAKGNVRDLKRWSEKNPNLILEIADNSKFRVYERNTRYDDPGESYISKKKIEFAEDDRVFLMLKQWLEIEFLL